MIGGDVLHMVLRISVPIFETCESGTAGRRESAP